MYDRPPKPQQHWSTADELKFLAHLGHWGDHRKDPEALLRRYREAMRWRTNWGSIAAHEVLAYLARRLKEKG